MSEEAPPPRTGHVDINDLVPCVAGCCCIYSLYTEIPDCFGSVCENTVLCMLCKIMACKASKEEGAFCKCLGFDIDCVPFATCCQAKSQFCCCDARISFPPTEQIPCMLTLCCITCCYKNQCVWCKCGADVRSIDEQVNGAKVSNKDYNVSGDADDWVEMHDNNTGKKYYLNKKTGKTQWESPY